MERKKHIRTGEAGAVIAVLEVSGKDQLSIGFIRKIKGVDGSYVFEFSLTPDGVHQFAECLLLKTELLESVLGKEEVNKMFHGHRSIPRHGKSKTTWNTWSTWRVPMDEGDPLDRLFARASAMTQTD